MKVTYLLTMMLAGCVPPSYAYMSLPLDNLEGRALALAVLEIPLAKLEDRLETLHPKQLAFYIEGRDPIPYQLIDRDDDGRADHALLKIPLGAEGGTLIVTSPGPRAKSELPPGGERYRIELRFDQARR